jgi:hypothetical protein
VLPSQIEEQNVNRLILELEIIQEDDPVPPPQLQAPEVAPAGSAADNMEGAEDDEPRQPRRRRRVTENVDVGALPNRIQERIQQLQAAITAQRPPPPQYARRGPPRRRSERWSDDENALLLLLRNNGFGYSQIEQYFPRRNRNPLERQGSVLKRGREKKGKKNSKKSKG